jgi:hypothetical protein
MRAPQGAIPMRLRIDRFTGIGFYDDGVVEC